jgi:predicted nucleic acid-binding Zn ribbon protein
MKTYKRQLRKAKKLREERKAQGLCPHCGKPSPPGKIYCDKFQQIIKNSPYRKSERYKLKRTGYKNKNLSQKRKNAERRQLIQDHYGNKCVCCGETIPEFLTIDHINRDGKEHRKSVGQLKMYQWIIENNFPTDLQLLCMNCNWGSRLTGICPHKKIPLNSISL